MPKFIAFFLVLVLLGMGLSIEQKHTDVSANAVYKEQIGRQYEVVGRVDAYGIRPHSQAAVTYVTLIPPPGIGGPEVGFRIPVVAGSKVTVTKVLKTNRLLDPDMTFEIGLAGTKLPAEMPIRIDLFRGNEGDSALQLNPGIYRKLLGTQ